MKYLNTDSALLWLRITFGVLMLTHGVPKIFMLGMEGPIPFPDPIGVGPTLSLILAIFAEVLCVLAVILGFWTRISSAFVAFTMFVAAFVVHFSDPLQVKEMALLYLFAFVAIIIAGPGKYSLDALKKK
jgi:putative oxidoreductase